MKELLGPLDFKYHFGNSSLDEVIDALEIARIHTKKGATIKSGAIIGDLFLCGIADPYDSLFTASARALATVAYYLDNQQASDEMIERWNQ